MRTAFLVYNPAAGRFPSRMLAERAATIFRKRGWQVRLEQSESGEQITQFARQAAEAGIDAFIVAGGDGSLNRALFGLIGSNTALGVLPAGTANVWAQELGLSSLTWTRSTTLEESATRLADAPIRKADVGLCNGLPFLLWAGVGLDAFVIHRIEPREPWEKRLAFLQYTASAVWNASFWRGMNLSIQVESRQLYGHYLLALISNVHLYVGGLMQLTPGARLDDGLMDLWLFEGETLGDTIQRVLDLISGRHLHSDRIIHLPFRSLSMESDSELYVQMDGEPADTHRPISIEILPRAIPVLIPQGSPRTLFRETEI
jgi:diacylglycerol kinase (ATP)